MVPANLKVNLKPIYHSSSSTDYKLMLYKQLKNNNQGSTSIQSGVSIEIFEIFIVLLRATFFECHHKKLNCAICIKDIELKMYTLICHTCNYIRTKFELSSLKKKASV